MTLALFTSDGIEVRDLNTGVLKFHFTDHSRAGYGIGFAPGGSYLVTGSYDQTFRFWNLANGRCLMTFQGYRENIYSAQFLSEKELMIGSSNGQMYYHNFK